MGQPAWVILLFIPIIGWILLVIEVAWYFSRKPDRCPICGTKLKLKNGKLVHEPYFGEFADKLGEKLSKHVEKNK